MSVIEEERATRHRTRKNGQKVYFTITEKSIMFHAEKEGDMSNADDYSAVNTICRLASKMRGLGASWLDIADQLDAGSMGSVYTWPALILQVIRDEGCLIGGGK